MKTELKDVLHLYHPQCGSKVQLPDGRIGEFHGINNSLMVKVFIDGGYVDEYVNHLKAVLRKLDSITESVYSEWSEYLKANSHLISGEEPFFWFEWTKFLLSKHFDIFNLIETGQAIDAETIKK